MTQNAVKKVRQRLRAKIGTDLQQQEIPMAKRTLKDDRKALKERELGRYNERNYREALRYIEELEMQVNAIEKLKSNRRTHKIRAYKSRGTDEATVVACLSDVHIGATVRPEQVQGLNQYNMEISRQRVDEFFSKIVKLTKKERQDVHISELVLFLGGDIIDGALHLDTIMANDVSEPMMQAVAAQNWIESGLLHLEPHFERITIVCKDGNHSRITQKQRHATRNGNSLEWAMYQNLAKRHPEFEWVIEDSYLTYYTVYDEVLRVHHGDAIRYMGGVGGLEVPMKRAYYQWNMTEPATINIMGHYHSYMPGYNTVNGSLIGYNAYAAQNKFAHQPPIQSYILLVADKGITQHSPILV